MTETEFGIYLKQLREERGLGVNQLGTYSGVSSSQISRIESGLRGIPKPETIEKLARALKVPYTEMMQKAGYLDFDSIVDGFEKAEEKPKEEDEQSPIPPAVKAFLKADTSGLTKNEQKVLADDLADYFVFRKNQLLRDKNND